MLHVEASSTPIRVATVNSQSKKASPVDKVLISGNPRFLTEENVTSSFIHVEGVNKSYTATPSSDRFP